MNRKEQVDFFRSQLEHCVLCPRRCGVNRLEGDVGICKAGTKLKVASTCQHTGEEPPISGDRGSGTVFFCYCNMACVYCQNYPISQLGYGNQMEIAELAGRMLDLEMSGAHNINLVTPTQFLPQIVEAVLMARDRGMAIPIVYNSSGFESVETLVMLEDIVQVYLVDMRYSTRESALRYSNAPDYPHHNRRAVKEMLRLVGHLECDKGVATSGLIVRHLLIPSLLSETDDILKFIACRLSRDTYISLMSQYFPANKASAYPEINRRVSRPEYQEAKRLLRLYGLEKGWIQDLDRAAGPVA